MMSSLSNGRFAGLMAKIFQKILPLGIVHKTLSRSAS